MPKKEYSQEVILEARRKRASGDFLRKVLSTRAFDLNWDEIKMDCGHETRSAPAFSSLMLEKDARMECSDCIRQWMDDKQAGEQA